MTHDTKKPLCPQCGEAARVVIVSKARVRCQLREDGSIGKVLSTSRTPDSKLLFECGGGHVFSK